MSQFLAPTSLGLLVLAVVLGLAVTAATAVLWDRQGWLAVRIVGPLLSMSLLAVGALIAINLVTSLFDTWSEVWVFVR